MKKILIFIIAITVSIIASAESIDTLIVNGAEIKKDTVYVGGSRNKSSKVSAFYKNYINREKRMTWFSFSWGYNGLVGSLKSLKAPSTLDFVESKFAIPQFTLHFFSVKFLRASNVFYLQSSLDFEFNNFRFKDGVTIQKSATGGIEKGTKIDPELVTKSKLSTNYLNIPLTAHIKFTRHFGIYGGVIGGVCYDAHTKLKYVDNNRTKKLKDNNIPVPTFRYGYVAGIEFKHISLYASYYPDSIFKGDQPNVAQANVGVRVSIF